MSAAEGDELLVGFESAIACEARPGDRLPLARDLATVLQVNTNTVLRALRTLRDESLLDFRRGRGITVTGTPQQGALLRRVNELVDYARSNGYRRDELITLINDVPWPGASTS